MIDGELTLKLSVCIICFGDKGYNSKLHAHVLKILKCLLFEIGKKTVLWVRYFAFPPCVKRKENKNNSTSKAIAE